MTKTTQIEVWVLVDDCGDAVASHSADELVDLYESHVQELAAAGGLRRVKVTLTVPLPAALEVSGVVADDGAAELIQAK